MFPPNPIPGELTALVHRERFDDLPGGVDHVHLPRWQEFRRQYHLAQRGPAPGSVFPLQVDFELNSTCNLKCSFCTHGQERVPNVELPFVDFVRVIDEGERYGLASIKLNYINEPLLRSDLPAFIRYAKDHGVLNVYFATNGVLLTVDVAHELITSGLSKILVSLDATTPETFRAMRNSGHFDRIERNISRLLELRKRLGVTWPHVRVNFLLTPRNFHEREAFLNRWEGIADSIGVQTQVALPDVDTEMYSAPREGPFRCSFPSKLLVVDHRGDILPCCTFSGRKMPLGNIATMTLGEAWNGPRATTLRVLHGNGYGMDNPICARCIGGGTP